MRLSLNKRGSDPGRGDGREGASGRSGAGPGEAIAVLRAYLQARGLRMTGEREALLRAALGRRSHFTLEDLAQDVLRSDGSASRATVFRSLPILVGAGILQPATVSGEARLFELALGRRHHDHLLCRGCGKLVEFRSEEIERLQAAIAARHGFRVTSHVHELVGECADCRHRRGTRGGDRAARHGSGPEGR